jgi:hypothetical protein
MDVQKTAAKLFATVTFVIGLTLFVVSLVVGIVFIVRTDANFRYYRFFLRHPRAEEGIYLIASAFTFWAPFTAFGAYLSTKLKVNKDKNSSN